MSLPSLLRLGVDTLEKCIESAKEDQFNKNSDSGDEDDEDPALETLDGDSLEICFAGRDVPFRRLSRGDVERVLRRETVDDLEFTRRDHSSERRVVEVVV
jgi:hypothetical protein